MNNDIEKATFNEIPSRRETLGEALSSLFSATGSGLWAPLTLAIGVASLGWLADSMLPILQDVSIVLHAKLRGQAAETKFSESLVKLVFPTLWFLALALFLYLQRRKNLQPIAYKSVVPEPHKGLIVMLSKYSPLHNQVSYASPDEIVREIQTGSLDLDKVFAGCNWGQMAFVVRYHAPALQRCWVLVTENSSEAKKDGSKDEFEQAKALIDFLTKNDRNIICEPSPIKNPNDIGETAQIISRIYRDLIQTESELKPDELISDFTGGTAAMSGGMILATLDEGREVEYVVRGVTLQQGITSQQVREQGLIISPRTSLRMVNLFAGKK